MIESLINQPCVITDRSQTGPPDAFGTPTWVEEDTDDLIHVQPVSSEEVEDRPAGKLTHRGFLRPTSVVRHTNKIGLVGGQSWEVDGPARIWTHPRTLENMYQEVDLVGYAVAEEESS